MNQQIDKQHPGISRNRAARSKSENTSTETQKTISNTQIKQKNRNLLPSNRSNYTIFTTTQANLDDGKSKFGLYSSYPLESDKLFKSHLYWIEDYKKRNERNVLENIEIQRVIPVDLMEDEFYLSYTVRIFANMVDYTVNKDNRVIDGNKNRVRYFSEYWTLIVPITQSLQRPKQI